MMIDTFDRINLDHEQASTEDVAWLCWYIFQLQSENGKLTDDVKRKRELLHTAMQELIVLNEHAAENVENFERLVNEIYDLRKRLGVAT